MEYLALIIFGILTGIASSLFGFGGGLIVVPLLYSLLPHSPYTMHIAVATSLAVMLVNTLFASYKHQTQKNIQWTYTCPLIYYIALGSLAGAYLTTKIASDVTRYLFIFYLLFIICYCVFYREFINANKTLIKFSWPANLMFGLVVGICSGSLGVGGSIMNVPLLRRLGLSMKQATATANVLTLPNALIASSVYMVIAFKQNIISDSHYLGLVYLPGFFILAITGVIGVPIGNYFANRISDKAHAIGFICLLAISLLVMLLK